MNISENKDSISKLDHVVKPVYVTIDPKLTYDLKAMNKVTQNVLEKLQCPGCHSGFAIEYQIERRLIVDKNLDVHNLHNAFNL